MTKTRTNTRLYLNLFVYESCVVLSLCLFFKSNATCNNFRLLVIELHTVYLWLYKHVRKHTLTFLRNDGIKYINKLNGFLLKYYNRFLYFKTLKKIR